MWRSKFLTQIRHTPKNVIAVLILIVSILLIIPYATASTYVPVDDNVYDILSRLEAEGVIKSALLTTKPLSHEEIARLVLEAERNSGGRSVELQRLIKILNERFNDEVRDVRFIKPIDYTYSKYVHTDSDVQRLNYNNDGDYYEKGSNFRFGLSSRTELGWFSLYINPELRYSDSNTDLIMKKAYGVLSFSGLELELGKDSQWWGPGYHGAIFVSNNPEPLTILKLTNSRPVILPSVFKNLGLFKFTIFATRLEKDREIPNPYLWGMRFNFKPNPYLELGLQRTALLGGEGRKEDLDTWWESFIFRAEFLREGPGDQKSGIDVKVTLPFRWQPLQLYAEAVAEDITRDLKIKGAYLAGLYLPRILNFARIDFRAEYAKTHKIMYAHPTYRSGYTFKGTIIGHHMGPDSKDIFLKTSYLIPEINGRISISYDREEHNLSAAIREKKVETNMRIYIRLMKRADVMVSYGYGKIKNLENISGEDKEINMIVGQINYKF